MSREEHGLNELNAFPTATNDRATYLESQEESETSDRGPQSTRDWEDGEEHGLDELVGPSPVELKSSSEKELRRVTEKRQRKSTSQQDSSGKGSKVATQVYIYAYLIFFAIIGTLARLGVQWLTFYPGAPVTISNLWANLGGTFFMGFLSQDKQLFREEWGGSTTSDEAAHHKVKKTIPLFIGLTTGFCGSFTSFSTFMRDVFLALSNDVPTPINHPGDTAPESSNIKRNRGYSFLAVLAILILTILVNVGALKCGAHLAHALDPFMPTLPFKFCRRVLDPLVIVLAVGSWLGAIFMAIWPPDRPSGPASRGPWDNETWRGLVIFALVFAPLGCVLRFLLAVKLNPIVTSFPLGTFAANVFGTAVLAMCYDLQHTSLLSVGGVGGGRVGCQVLQGVEDGFDGCLTTISTWIVELTTLKRRHAYFYGAVSVATGLSVVVVVMGSVRWTVGFTSPACVVEIT